MQEVLAKKTLGTGNTFCHLSGMYLHKELIIAMKVIIIFKEDFTEFCNANYILTVYPQIH